MTQTKALVKIKVNNHSKFIFRSYKCLQGPCYYQAGSLDLADVTDCDGDGDCGDDDEEK